MNHALAHGELVLSCTLMVLVEYYVDPRGRMYRKGLFASDLAVIIHSYYS